MHGPCFNDLFLAIACFHIERVEVDLHAHGPQENQKHKNTWATDPNAVALKEKAPSGQAWLTPGSPLVFFGGGTPKILGGTPNPESRKVVFSKSTLELSFN